MHLISLLTFYNIYITAAFASAQEVTEVSCNKTTPCKGAKQGTPVNKIPYNGCGSQSTGAITKALNGGILSKLPGSFQSCCNTHDVCYGKATGSKNSCDQSFKSCLSSAQKNISNFALKTLLATAPSIMYTAVSVGGCGAYDSAQKRHVKC